MIYYARSASFSAPNQPYPEHITHVLESAARFWAEASRYWRGKGNTDLFAGIVRSAAAFHDLGKLEDENQKVLSGKIPHAHLTIPLHDVVLGIVLCI